MNFITEALGVSFKIINHNGIPDFPYYITDNYILKNVLIDNLNCILISPKIDIQNISIIKNNVEKIRQMVKIPVILELDTITKYRCDILIKEKIPFIVKNKQIYLPFLGIYLQEKFSTEQKKIEKFIPSTQVILFRYIYKCLEVNNTIELSSSDFENLNFSNMTISRAFNQLEDTNLMISKKYGVSKVIYTNLTPQELYNQAEPYLINPIRKIIYIDKKNLLHLENKVLSGLSQLSNISMLNPPKIVTYATDRIPKFKTYTQLDSFNHQVELEVWKYKPNILTENETIDTLSLISSLRSNADERIQTIINDLLKNIWHN